MTCLGQVYRCSIEPYPGHRGFSARTRFRLIKSVSCSGCPECDEVTRAVDVLGKGAHIGNLGVAVHGRAYRVRVKR